MNIEFSKEQYEQLIKVVYLGNWMANASRTDDMIPEYEDIQEYVLAHAKDFGLENLADGETLEDKKFIPSQELEVSEDIEQLITDYDDEVFWEELIERMTIKDIFSSMGEEELEAMEEENFSELYETVREKYEEEFDENGLMNVDLCGCADDCDDCCGGADEGGEKNSCCC